MTQFKRLGTRPSLTLDAPSPNPTPLFTILMTPSLAYSVFVLCPSPSPLPP